MTETFDPKSLEPEALPVFGEHMLPQPFDLPMGASVGVTGQPLTLNGNYSINLNVPSPRCTNRGNLCWYAADDVRNITKSSEWKLGYFQEFYFADSRTYAVAVIVTLEGEVVERMSSRVSFSPVCPAAKAVGDVSTMY